MKTYCVTMLGILLVFVISAVFAGEDIANKAITIEQLLSRIEQLEQRVAVLEEPKSKVTVYEREKEKERSRGTQYYYPGMYFYNGNRCITTPHPFMTPNQYTNRTYERVYKRDQVDRDKYEQQHGERYVSPQ